MTRTVLLTGAAGFLGRHVAEALAARGGDEVVAVLRRMTTGPWRQCAVVDLRDGALVRDLVGRVAPDVVLHLAGRTHGSAAELVADNTLATANVVDAVAALRPQARLVVAGSAAEYGAEHDADAVLHEHDPCAPRHPYGVTKLAATRLALGPPGGGRSVAVARLANLLGPGLSPRLLPGALVQQLAACRRAGQPFTVHVGARMPRRDYVDVDDAARALLALVDGSATGVFHVASGVCHSVDELIEVLQQLVGAPIVVAEDARLRSPGTAAAVRLSTAAAATAIGFSARTGLRESLARMWATALAGTPAQVGA